MEFSPLMITISYHKWVLVMTFEKLFAKSSKHIEEVFRKRLSIPLDKKFPTYQEDNFVKEIN